MLLLSIRPRFVDAILSGEKTIELRRRAPKRKVNSAYIYATSPRMELVATTQIVQIRQVPLALLWQLASNCASVSRREFDDYFVGLKNGISIELASVRELERPFSLDELRRTWQGFNPPQGFCYLTPEEVSLVTDVHKRGHVA